MNRRAWLVAARDANSRLKQMRFEMLSEWIRALWWMDGGRKGGNMEWVGTKTQINERNSKTYRWGWLQCVHRNTRTKKFCKTWHRVTVQTLVGERC